MINHGLFRRNSGVLSRFLCRRAPWGIALPVFLFFVLGSISSSWAQKQAHRIIRPGHVAEMTRYLGRLEIGQARHYRGLAVYPVSLRGDERMAGHWLTLDLAIQRGVLEIAEKSGGGSVPVVIVENKSRDEFIFMMCGEVLAGGKQTRTLRQDVILSPGQRLDISVFCVEQHRWSGQGKFESSGIVVPQSIQKSLRLGADQKKVWAEVARNNAALKSTNKTQSLQKALASVKVRAKLSEVRRVIAPGMPKNAIGFIFVHYGRAVGAEFFGHEQFAQQYLPKLLDSYAVDFVLQGKPRHGKYAPIRIDTARAFLNRIRRAGSSRSSTPGAGAGIQTRSSDLVGSGVSQAGTLVHFGVQASQRFVPMPIIRPGIEQRPHVRIQPAPQQRSSSNAPKIRRPPGIQKK